MHLTVYRQRRISALSAAFSAVFIAIFVAGCAAVPPPGAPAARLTADDMQRIAPAISTEETQRLTQLNTRILSEQESAIAREETLKAYADAVRAYVPPPYIYGGYGWPGRYYGMGIGYGW